MKIPFLNKNFSSSISSNSTSWPCPSCHQNPRTLSFRATLLPKNPTELDGVEEEEEEEKEEEKSVSVNIFSSSTTDAIEELAETDAIESVIKGIRSSKRLIFEHKGESNSILEEVKSKDPCSCRLKQSTLSLNSTDSWWRWLRYTHFLTAREASKCIVKTTK